VKQTEVTKIFQCEHIELHASCILFVEQSAYQGIMLICMKNQTSRIPNCHQIQPLQKQANDQNCNREKVEGAQEHTRSDLRFESGMGDFFLPKRTRTMGTGCSTVSKGSASAPVKASSSSIPSPCGSIHPLDSGNAPTDTKKDIAKLSDTSEGEGTTSNGLSHAKATSLKVVNDMRFFFTPEPFGLFKTTFCRQLHSMAHSAPRSVG
jgi:hypothetical protein